MHEKFQYYNGVKFTRDEDTGYYLNSTLHIRMHQYVWVCEKGDIPKGYHIHHIDGDRGNNDISNLQLLTSGEHISQHWKNKSKEEIQKYRDNLDKNARPKAIEWHKSEEGREWHREHMEKLRAEGRINAEKSMVCQQCGKVFVGRYSWSKFCSGKCKSKARRDSGIDNETRTCEICGSEFSVNKYSKITTCSRRCGNMLRARTMKETKNA